MKRAYTEAVKFSNRHPGLAVVVTGMVLLVLSGLIHIKGFDVLSIVVDNCNELNYVSYQIVNTLMLLMFFLIIIAIGLIIKMSVFYIRAVIDKEKDYWQRNYQNKP